MAQTANARGDAIAVLIHPEEVMVDGLPAR
jgi:hypothetical protein